MQASRKSGEGANAFNNPLERSLSDEGPAESPSTSRDMFEMEMDSPSMRTCTPKPTRQPERCRARRSTSTARVTFDDDNTGENKWVEESARTNESSKAPGAHDYVAVACSGGGARSQAFCSGVLAALYERSDLTVTSVSACSGGTWAATGFEFWRQRAEEAGEDPRKNKEWIYEYLLHTSVYNTAVFNQNVSWCSFQKWRGAFMGIHPWVVALLCFVLEFGALCVIITHYVAMFHESYAETAASGSGGGT